MAKKSLLEKCAEIVTRHAAFLVQHCKIRKTSHAEIAKHLFESVKRIGVVPEQKCRVLYTVLKNENGMRIAVDFRPNRYLLSVVLDWCLRNGIMNNGASGIWLENSEGLAYQNFSRRWKSVPSDYHIDAIRSNALGVIFGASPNMIAVFPKKDLRPLDKWLRFTTGNQNKRTKVLRMFYCKELGTSFYAHEDSAESWLGQNVWRIVTRDPYDVLTLSASRSVNLPRLAMRLATTQFELLELGPMTDKIEPLAEEDKLSRDLRRTEKGDGFPWMAYIQSGCLSKFEEMVIRAELDDSLDNLDKAAACGVQPNNYYNHRRRIFKRAKRWYQHGGLDLS